MEATKELSIEEREDKAVAYAEYLLDMKKKSKEKAQKAWENGDYDLSKLKPYIIDEKIIKNVSNRRNSRA